ncbi:MAG: hypothetical protein U5R31_04485 [Acidimicrobiia bacterium]|nr:hypothetical protein [Acidimicrobiia bacterium]
MLGYLNVAALRQHIGPAERIHGIFTHGGDKPNVVPARAAMHWYVRSPTLGALASLRDRVGLALEAGASAAGCEVELDWRGPVYAEMVEIRRCWRPTAPTPTGSGGSRIRPLPAPRSWGAPTWATSASECRASTR